MRYWVVGLALVFVVAGCAKVEQQDIVATVADREIPLSKITDYFDETILPYLPSAEDEYRRKKELLDSLVAEELYKLAAYVHGLDNDIEVLELVEAERGKFLLDELYRFEISEKSEVTEEEILEWYDHFFTRIRGRHLVVETREQADSLHAAITAGASFNEAARLHSLDPLSRRRGGDMGKYYNWGELVPSFQHALFTLGDDTISTPVKTDYGWHLIEVLDRRNIDPEPLDSMREIIHTKIKSQKDQDRQIEHRMEVRERYPITLLKEGLELLARKTSEYARIDTLDLPDSLRRDAPFAYLTPFEQDKPLARYMEDRTLTIGEYLQLTNPVPPERKPTLNDEAAMKVFVFEELLYEFLYAEAQRLDLQKSKVYQDRMKEFIEILMADKMRNSVVIRDVSVSESDMREYFEANPDSFMTDLKLRVREMLVYTKETADSLYRQLQQGRDFAELARQRTTRKGYQRSGGDLGYLKPYRKEIMWEKAMTMNTGEISEPFLTEEDWSIIKLEERIEPQPQVYDSVKADLFYQLQEARIRGLQNSYIDSLRTSYPVTENFELLRSTIDSDRYAEKADR